MTHHEEAIARQLAESMRRGRLTRREAVRRAAALGVSVPFAAAMSRAGAAVAQDASPAASPSASPAAAPPSGEPILIGASVSTTGSNGRTGLYQQEAYLLWESQKNQSGGVLGRPVRMVIYDDQSDPATGARLYQRLLDEDGVNLILGPYASGVTQAVAQVTEPARQPLLVAGASAGEIWDRGFRYVFGVYSIAQDYFRDIIQSVASAQGYTSAAIMHEDALFPQSTADGAEAYCEEGGIEVLLKEIYPQEATDVSSVLTRIRDEDPDMLIGGSYLPDSVLIVRQAKELGVNPRLYAFSVGAAQPEFVENLGADADYVLGPSMWEAEIETPGNAEFLAAYQQLHGRDPDYHAATGYAGCQILEAAVNAAGSLDTEAVTEQLRTLVMPTVLPGEYRVDETGQQVGHIPLSVQWQGGLKVIVAPENLATGQIILPTPPWDQR
ncbi:MAG: amino acid ABC transporter substrate-binding protein [Chloroflexota bacterium]|nr:amino acid ABC transporter substrate-binding protein [Chloroflexota bacterium]